MQNSTLKIQELNTRFSAGEISEGEFMFLVKQSADRFHQKFLDQTDIRPLPSRMGTAKKVSRRFVLPKQPIEVGDDLNTPED